MCNPLKHYHALHPNKTNRYLFDISIFQHEKCGRQLRGDPDDKGHRIVERRSHLAASGNLQIFMCYWCRIFSLRHPNLHVESWILDLWWISGGPPVVYCILLPLLRLIFTTVLNLNCSYDNGHCRSWSWFLMETFKSILLFFKIRSNER